MRSCKGAWKIHGLKGTGKFLILKIKNLCTFFHYFVDKKKFFFYSNRSEQQKE
jgi:hypothetical protein